MPSKNDGWIKDNFVFKTRSNNLLTLQRDIKGPFKTFWVGVFIIQYWTVIPKRFKLYSAC